MGLLNHFHSKGLWSLAGPETAPIGRVFEHIVCPARQDGVSARDRHGRRTVFRGCFYRIRYGFMAYKGPGRIVNNDDLVALIQLVQGPFDGLLPFFSSGDKDKIIASK